MQTGASLICTGNSNQKSPEGFSLTNTDVPKPRVLRTVVIVIPFEGSIDTSTELLRLKHCRKLVVCGLTDQDLQILTVVSDGAECLSVPESEASHGERVLGVHIKGWCSFCFYRISGLPNCGRNLIHSCRHNDFFALHHSPPLLMVC